MSSAVQQLRRKFKRQGDKISSEWKMWVGHGNGEDHGNTAFELTCWKIRGALLSPAVLAIKPSEIG